MRSSRDQLPGGARAARAWILLLTGALGLAAVAAPGGRALGNLFSLLIDPVYVIPAESSLFAFRATVMNSGSGDWWLYGEDGRRYYAYLGEADRPYVTYAKERARSCPGFDPHEIATWCE